MISGRLLLSPTSEPVEAAELASQTDQPTRIISNTGSFLGQNQERPEIHGCDSEEEAQCYAHRVLG